MLKAYSNNLTQSRYGMSGRLLLKKLVTSLLFFIPLLGFLYFFLLVLGIRGTMLRIDIASASVLLYIFFIIFEVNEIKSVYYEVKKSYFIIKSKIIDPADTIIEYERIKKIEISKDFVDLLLGLRTVVIFTDFSQGGVHRKSKIEGLSKIKAEGLKKLIDDSQDEWFKTKDTSKSGQKGRIY